MLVLGAKLIIVLTHGRNVCLGVPGGSKDWPQPIGGTGPVRFNPIWPYFACKFNTPIPHL
jgi:hypothetical protein